MEGRFVTFTRSTILTRPQPSISATSPVCSQPSSSIVSLVFFSSARCYMSPSSLTRTKTALTLIITNEAVDTTTAQLATGVWLVLRCVSHGRDINKLELGHSSRRPNSSTRGWVVRKRMCTHSGVLGHAVSSSSSSQHFTISGTSKQFNTLNKLVSMIVLTAMIVNSPSVTVPPNAIFKKSMTSLLIGAEPQDTSLTLPPSTA